MTDAATHEPLRIGVLGAARITSLSLVEPARATGHRLVAVAARPLFEDTVHRRPYCGEGSFDLTGMDAALRTAGWSGPWAVEILSDEHRTMPVEAALSRAADSARHVL